MINHNEYNYEDEPSLFKKILGYAAQFAASAFLGACAADIAKRSGANKVEQGAVVVGGMLVGSMVGDQVGNYVVGTINKYQDQYKRIRAAEEDDD